jgi:hypothetical protein
VFPGSLLLINALGSPNNADTKESEPEANMKDLEDVELKTEMDEIMRCVESIMKKVEAVLPPKSEAPSRTEE